MDTTYRFDAHALKARLDLLVGWQRMIFGLFLLERALPNFLQFQSETGAVGGAVLRATLAQLWNSTEHDAGDLWQFVTPEMCSRVAPDTDNYRSLYTSSALDAVAIAENLILYSQNEDVGLLVASAALRRDSIDLFIQNSENIDPGRGDLEAYLTGHPLMQEELGFQFSDVVFLKELATNRQMAWRHAIHRLIDLDYGRLRMRL